MKSTYPTFKDYCADHPSATLLSTNDLRACGLSGHAIGQCKVVACEPGDHPLYWVREDDPAITREIEQWTPAYRSVLANFRTRGPNSL